MNSTKIRRSKLDEISISVGESGGVVGAAIPGLVAAVVARHPAHLHERAGHVPVHGRVNAAQEAYYGRRGGAG